MPLFSHFATTFSKNQNVGLVDDYDFNKKGVKSYLIVNRIKKSINNVGCWRTRRGGLRPTWRFVRLYKNEYMSYHRGIYSRENE